MSGGFLIEENLDGESVLIKYTGKEAEVVIPEEVTEIGKGSFEGCTNLPVW